ncbi:MAG: PH domain-containing protein [Alphaproteobacteria bacterium]
MQLDPKAVLYFMLRSSAAIIFVSIWTALLFTGGHQPLHPQSVGFQWGSTIGNLGSTASIFLCGLLFINWIYCRIKVRSYQIEMRPDGISLNYGILNKSREILLFAKIQDILITQSILERLLGLATLTVQNAMGTPERIPGLDAKAAEAFRDSILSRIKH